jgi:hypothetical protein
MAAGLGFKTFETGDVLTAGDTNGYLMQGVLVFASAAARDAAITSPQEGQFAYLKDTNVTMYYTGSAWANLDTTGMTNPMTTTGDTIYSSSGSTPARLGIGSTGQVLTVASGVPSWATPSAAANEAVGYKYTLWNPTNTTGTTTNAPATGTSSGNTTNISVSNSSGTLTATLAATGLYLFTFTGNLSVQDAYGYAEMRAAFGGTATLFIDTTNPAAQWGDGDTDGNMTLSASFLLNVASANQTVTVLPDGRIGTGFATTSYDFTANVAIVRM